MSTRRYLIRTPEDLGRTLAEARHFRGLTQQQLAHQAKVERTYVAKLEAGHTVLQIERLIAMLRELGVELHATQESADG
jgi:transcriptional regulator with XRE-family HTH domain